MDDLLKLAVEGHGGWPRWRQISRFRAAASITGTIWTLKGRPGLLDGVVLEGRTRSPGLTITPFPRAGCRATWEPGRETIETGQGTLVAERGGPPAAFVAAARRSPWDALQVAYFAGEACWSHFVAPFLLTRGDVVTEESWPWREDGEVWRTLLVTCPDTLVAHTQQQTCYFDDAGLLRRVDSALDALGGCSAVHYPSRYREFDGIKVATRRRVYVRDIDGYPLVSSVVVAIDLTEVTFR